MPHLARATARRIHWPIDDPAGDTEAPVAERLERFRAARDAIAQRLAELAL